MAYRIDFAASARRHLRAAQKLYQTGAPGAQPGSRAVAGYLFGLSGELAVKEMMRLSGIRPRPPTERRDDPFYAHFPALKTYLSVVVQGRRTGELRRMSEDDKLFQFWDTDMRYAPTIDVSQLWIAAWKESAEHLVATMDLL